MNVRAYIIFLWVWLVGPFAFAKGPITGDVSRVADTAHFEFNGQKNWDYEVKRADKNHIVLTLPPFDAATEAKLLGFADPFIEGVQVDKQGADGTYQVTLTLSSSDIESFDYLTDDPSRLIVDFYKKAPEPKPVVATADATAKTTANAPPKHRTVAANKKNKAGNRQPAGDEVLQVDAANGGPSPLEEEAAPDASTPIELRSGAFDAADNKFDRFRVKDYEIHEDAVYAAEQNIYLQFPRLELPVSRLDQMMKDMPEYVIHEKDNSENKEARLLQVLFERGRRNVFLKTFEHFVKKYPESDYLEIVRNMKANIHLMNWKETGSVDEYNLARDSFVNLTKNYPDSPLAQRNNLILGYLQLEHGEALATIQHFNGFLERFPHSPEVPQAKKAIAQALLMIRKYDDSLKVYESIATDFKQTTDGPEARYRMGDVEFARENWKGAVELYRKVLKELPQFSQTYPNARFNIAEALFWKKDYRASLDEFVNFLNSFPTHRYGGYAMTRIGEIMGILGVDSRRAMGAFLESSFRYPDNPGAKVARLRMLTAQMRGMRPKDLKKALDEIKNSIHEVQLPGMDEFSTLLLSEGLQNRGSDQDALKLLIDYYQDHPTLKNKEQMTSGILRSIASYIKQKVTDGQFLEALQFEAKYDKTWLHNRGRIDVPYFVGRAYEEAGAWDEAEHIYTTVLENVQKIAGTREEKLRRAAEYLPRRSTLELRLANVDLEKRRYADAYQHLKNLKNATDLTEAEQVERVQSLATVAEFRGELPVAIGALKDLTKRWKGEPELLEPALLKLTDLELRSKAFTSAETHADQILVNKEVKDDVKAKALELKGDALLGQKRTMAAVETYQNLLEQFESKRPLGAVRYKIGQLLFNNGDLKAAEQIWGKLQGGGANETYWDLAKEKLDHAKWQGEYKKYVDRIPAMSGKESQQ